MSAHASPYRNKIFAPSSMSANDRPFINEFKYKKDDLGLRKSQKKCVYRYHWFKYLCVCIFHLSLMLILLNLL